MRKYLVLVKVIITAVLLVMLFRTFPMHDVFSKVRDMDLYLFALVLILAGGIWFLQALRWKRTMPLQEGGNPPIRIFLYYTALGYFFNLLLPSGIGGDAVKSVAYGRRFQVTADSVASVFMARVMGVSLMLLTFWGAVAWWSGQVPKAVLAAMAVLSGMTLAGWVVLLGPWEWSVLQNTRLHFLLNYRKSMGAMGRIWSETLGVQVLTIVQQWLFFWCVGVPMPIWLVALFLPPIFLLTMVPVSLFGVGVREWATVGLYTLSGFSAADCLAASGPAYLLVLIQAGVGGLWLAARQMRLAWIARKS